MKNIIPFKKDVIFKTKLSEITSISLEHTLSLDKDVISGDFIVSGEYKVSDGSTTVEPFELKLPFEIVIDERYDTKRAVVDIDDFYYEIVNNNVLSVSIDVLIDKLEEKTLVELEDLVDVTPVREVLDYEEDDTENISEISEDLDKSEYDKKDECSEEEIRQDIIEKESEKSVIEEKERNENIMENAIENTRKQDTVVEENINSLFNQFSKDSEVFVTYNVFILRDGDSIDSIMEKYNISEEELKKYNDLSNLQLGDKLIIPNVYERD